MCAISPIPPDPTPPEDAWTVLHSGTLALIEQIRQGKPVLPVQLNPLAAAVRAPTIAWSSEQRWRAMKDLDYAEQELARRRPFIALRLFIALKQRLEREGVAEASRKLCLVVPAADLSVTTGDSRLAC